MLLPMSRTRVGHALSFLSSADVGSLGSVLYMFESARRVLIFPSYAVQSITTVAFPLSAITMSSASLRVLWLCFLLEKGLW